MEFLYRRVPSMLDTPEGEPTGHDPGPGNLAFDSDSWISTRRVYLNPTDAMGQVSIAALVGRPAGGNELWLSNDDFPRKWIAYRTHGAYLSPDNAFQTILVSPWAASDIRPGMPLDVGDINVEVKSVAPNAWQYRMQSKTTDLNECGNGEIVFNAPKAINTTKIAIGAKDANDSDPVSLYTTLWRSGLLTAFRADWTVPFWQFKILGSAQGQNAGIFDVEYGDFTAPGFELEDHDIMPDGTIVNVTFTPGVALGPAAQPPVVPNKVVRFVNNPPVTAPGPNELKVAVWVTQGGQVKGTYLWQEKVAGKPVTPKWVKVA